MTDTSTPEPGENAGVSTLRLDADRTRDELESTLQEIEQRLKPAELKGSLRRTYRAHRTAFWAVGAGLAGGIALVSLLVVKRRG
jgi:hypothetical protein